ncbi:MAG: DUF7133 domain-containing protein, partial [Planctomycetia bacterium]
MTTQDAVRLISSDPLLPLHPGLPKPRGVLTVEVSAVDASGPSRGPPLMYFRLRFLPFVVALFAIGLFCSEASAAAPEAPSVGLKAPSLDRPPRFRVPDGFTIEPVAVGLVEHPMLSAMDDCGRLYVSESAGLNLARPELDAAQPNFILRLEDADGDGKFDKATRYAEGMTFPMGGVWHEGALYVASSGAIWKFEDVDDDGVAEKKTQLVGTFGYNGNGCDLHGCFLAPSGRLYWCEGRHGHDIAGAVMADGRPSKGLAARIFSSRLDGTGVEVHCGGGMDNPVELIFTPDADVVGTVALFEGKPQRQDALVHWAWGGVYPYHHCLAEFKRTGGLMPPLSTFGQVAPSGLVQYRGANFGADYVGSLFHAQFNTHKIVRTELVRDGSSW